MVFKRLGDFLEKSFEHLPSDGRPAMTFRKEDTSENVEVAEIGNGNENKLKVDSNGKKYLQLDSGLKVEVIEVEKEDATISDDNADIDENQKYKDWYESSAEDRQLQARNTLLATAQREKNRLITQQRLGRYAQKRRGGVLRYPLEALTEHADYLQIDIEKSSCVHQLSLN